MSLVKYLFVVVLFLGGCAEEASPIAEVREIINKTQWSLSSYSEVNQSSVSIIEGTEYILDFDEADKRVYIVLDCKDFVTTYNQTNSKLILDEVFSLESGCEFSDVVSYEKQNSVIQNILKNSPLMEQTKTLLTLTYNENKLIFKKLDDDSFLENNYEVSELIPFKSDGCSGFFDGNLFGLDLWRHCCVSHDFAYWKGGSRQQKKDADLELKFCVEDTGESAVAALMYEAVLVGGNPSFPTTYRWGFGWPYPQVYHELLLAEQLEINKVSFIETEF